MLLWILLAAAGVLRVVYLLQYRAEVPFLEVPISDSAYYQAWAERVAAGEGYGPRPFYMAPLYPTLLGLLYRVTGPRPEVVAYVQCALGLLNLWLVARLGRRVAGPWAGLLGAVLLTLYAPVLFLETKILTETLTITLLLLAVLVGSRALAAPEEALRSCPLEDRGRGSGGGSGQTRPGGRIPSGTRDADWTRSSVGASRTFTVAVRFFVTGVLLGLSVLARPNLLALPVLAGLWAVLCAIRHRPVAPARHLVLAAAGLAGTIAPVTVRNAVVGHDHVVISSNGGIVFAQGNHPDATGVSTILPGFTPRIEEQQEQELRIASQALGREVRPSESSAFWFRKGLAFAWEDPAGFAELWLRKAAWSLHAREPRDVYNLAQEAEIIPMLNFLCVPFPVIFGLAMVGAVRRPRPLPPGATLSWLGVATVGATLVVFSMSFRYRAPAVPLLAPFAGIGLLRLAESVRGLWRPAGAGGWARRGKPFALVLACVVLPSLVSLIPYPIPAVTAEAPANMGAAFLKRGQVGLALAWTRRALAMDPGLASAQYNLGLALWRLGDRDGAIRAFEASLASRPDDPAVLNDLAVVLDETGRKEEAVTRYRQALASRPEGRIAYNLALALYDLGRFDDALAALRTAESLGHPPDPAFVRVLRERLDAVPDSSPFRL